MYARPATRSPPRFFSDVNELRGVCRNGRVETPLGSFAAPHLAEHAAAPRLHQAAASARCRRADRHSARASSASEFLGEIDHVTLDVPGLDAPVIAARVRPRAARARRRSVDLEVESPATSLVVPDDES